MTILFSVLAVAGVLLPILAPSNDRQTGRRLFWAGFVVATAAAFLVAYPSDWKSGTALALTADVLMLLNAYFSTSHIKLRGKIYAFNLKDSQPDPSPDGATPHDSYPNSDPTPSSYSGMATAQKTWWLMVCVISMCALAVVIRAPDKPLWLTPLMAGAGIIFATGLGYGDAAQGFAVARGQRIQFVVVSIISAGVFAVLYFAAYRIAARQLRRKQSIEDRAHSRHQKR